MTKAPRWLDYQWALAQVPEPLLSGTLEERAERNLELVRTERDKIENKKTIRPPLTKALALDLASAAAEQRKWLKPVERLLVYVLKLPEEHEAGGWDTWTLDKRGRRKPEDIEAWSTAAMIDPRMLPQVGQSEEPTRAGTRPTLARLQHSPAPDRRVACPIVWLQGGTRRLIRSAKRAHDVATRGTRSATLP